MIASSQAAPIAGSAGKTGRARALRLGRLACIGLALAGTLGPRDALAQSDGQVRVSGMDGSTARRLELGIGKSVIVDLPRDAKEVFVANPKVANAVVRSTRKIFLIGMADGFTSVFVFDAEGRQMASLEINIGRDLNQLKQLLRTAMPKSKIEATAIKEMIVLTGTVDSPGEAKQAEDIAKSYIGTSSQSQQGAGVASSTTSEGSVVNSITIRGRDQVMLKVTVAEVQRTVLKQLGVDSAGNWQIGSFGIRPTLDNPLPLQIQQLSDTNIMGGWSGGGNSQSVRLRAFERAGVMRTLAEPTLTAISGETAKFTAGGEIPIPRSEEVSVDKGTGQRFTRIAVEHKPFGVTLLFSPVVLSEGRISLRIVTEVTEIDGENAVRFSTVNIPAFRVRKAETTVELPSGASLVTAGLIQQQTRQVVNGLPGLMNLPILGTLFRSRDYQRQETELMIIATPFIAKPSAPGDLARPDEGFVEAHDAQTVLMGRLNRIYGVAGAPNTGGRYRGHVGFIAE